MQIFLEKYFSDLIKLIESKNNINENLLSCKKLFEHTKTKNGKVIIMGNGGSAAMASHVSVDLTKNADIRAVNFNEADLITCFANDFGYENWMSEALRMYSDSNDIIILISSSGKSPNVVNAGEWCNENSLPFITFTGMEVDNPLKSVNNKGLNFWVDSRAYNHIEMVHHIWLLAIVDMIIGKAEYPAS